PCSRAGHAHAAEVRAHRNSGRKAQSDDRPATGAAPAHPAGSPRTGSPSRSASYHKYLTTPSQRSRPVIGGLQRRRRQSAPACEQNHSTTERKMKNTKEIAPGPVTNDGIWIRRLRIIGWSMVAILLLLPAIAMLFTDEVQW